MTARTANILITGASRGIGFALTQRAIQRGDTAFAAVRHVRQPAGPDQSNVHWIKMDVADTASVENAFLEVDTLLQGRRLDAVINAAAISIPGAIELTAVADYETTLNTNALGSLRVLKSAIPRLRGHGGRMIFVTSLWGRVSGAMLSAYCMSKHAVESLADAARREIRGMDMHVIVVEPGVVRTDMYKMQGPLVQESIDRLSVEARCRYGALYQRYLVMVGGAGGTGSPGEGISADECAADIEQALFDPHPRTRYRSGEDARRICSLAARLSDSEMDDLMLARLNNEPL